MTMVQGRSSPISGVSTLVVVAVGIALGGCGDSSHTTSTGHRPTPLETVCAPAARAAIAQFLGVEPSTISARASISNEATPQCVFRGGAVKVTANVDTGPQPYFRLERTVVEAGQQFGTVRLEPAPVNIPKMGLDADWFPGEHQVMTTDGKRLITVGVASRRTRPPRQRALAQDVARTYLSKPDVGAANGYPSG